MSGETEKNVSGWTVDTLKEHVDSLLTERDLRFEQRVQSIETADSVSLANERDRTVLLEQNSVYWREQANEWRGTMNDRERAFAMKPELEAIGERVGKIERELASTRGAAQRSTALLAVFLIVFVPLVVFIANYVTAR